jgi:hypothetical protein
VNDVHANTHCQVFLVTNSLPEFTDLLCTYIMGENWRTLFRLVIFQARKPHFFTHGCQRSGFFGSAVCFNFLLLLLDSTSCAKTTLDAVAAFKTTLHGPMQVTQTIRIDNKSIKLNLYILRQATIHDAQIFKMEKKTM